MIERHPVKCPVPRKEICGFILGKSAESVCPGCFLRTVKTAGRPERKRFTETETVI